MDNADLEVLSHLTNSLKAGQKGWLCTVVKTWGSSPRPVGSLLCCNSEGVVAGSLSGGCVEDDLIEKLLAGIHGDKPAFVIYGKTQEESDKFGLPCGGQLHIIIEPFLTDAAVSDLEQIVARIEARDCIQRTVNLTTGEMTVEPKERFELLKLIGDLTDPASSPTLVHTYGPRYRLFLIGAGPVSRYLAQMALTLDYQVIACDPRPEVIEQWPVEGAQLLNMMPDDAIRQEGIDEHTAIIALTHDPRIDDMGLMEALQSDEAFFIGAMGSTRTSAKRKERLLMLDLTEEQISRLHGPVGLSIGSKTPAEIAIAILAQLTQLRSEKMAQQKSLEDATS